MSRARRVTARLATVVAGVVVALVIAEIACRVLVPPLATDVLRGLHTPRPGRGWLYGLEPGAQRTSPEGDVLYAINGDGFRDHDYARVKPGGTFRTLVIGDSIAFGYGVALESTFVKLLEKRLRNAAVEPRFEVLDLGVSGYNPYTEAELLDDVGVGYAPDLVLVQFCVNDLNDPTLHFDASTMLELGAVPDAAFPDPASRREAKKATWTDSARRVCRLSRLCARAEEAWAPASTHDELFHALAPHNNPSPAELAWLQAIYERMLRTARAHGAPFVLIVFPHQGQLAGAPTTLQGALNALGERAGFPVIDLLPAFRRADASGGPPLFLDIWHPTQRGQEVAAEEIFRQLACKGLLPGVTTRCDAP